MRLCIFMRTFFLFYEKVPFPHNPVGFFRNFFIPICCFTKKACKFTVKRDSKNVTKGIAMLLKE